MLLYSLDFRDKPPRAQLWLKGHRVQPRMGWFIHLSCFGSGALGLGAANRGSDTDSFPLLQEPKQKPNQPHIYTTKAFAAVLGAQEMP